MRVLNRIRKVRTSARACVALALLGCLSMTPLGCTSEEQKQVKQVVARIGAEIPKVLPVLQAAESVAANMLPADAAIITSASGFIQAGLGGVGALCSAYAASPSDTAWQSIQATITGLINSGASALLDAARIVDPVSRQKAMEYLGGLQTALLIIDGLIQSAQSRSQVKAATAMRPVKLRQIEPYLDRAMVERETGHSFSAVFGYETSLGF